MKTKFEFEGSFELTDGSVVQWAICNVKYAYIRHNVTDEWQWVERHHLIGLAMECGQEMADLVYAALGMK